MENIAILRQLFVEAQNAYATSIGSSSFYYEGKMVGMIDTVATILGIDWIEADVLLRKTQ